MVVADTYLVKSLSLARLPKLGRDRSPSISIDAPFLEPPLGWGLSLAVGLRGPVKMLRTPALSGLAWSYVAGSASVRQPLPEPLSEALVARVRAYRYWPRRLNDFGRVERPADPEALAQKGLRAAGPGVRGLLRVAGGRRHGGLRPLPGFQVRPLVRVHAREGLARPARVDAGGTIAAAAEEMGGFAMERTLAVLWSGFEGLELAVRISVRRCLRSGAEAVLAPSV